MLSHPQGQLILLANQIEDLCQINERDVNCNQPCSERSQEILSTVDLLSRTALKLWINLQIEALLVCPDDTGEDLADIFEEGNISIVVTIATFATFLYRFTNVGVAHVVCNLFLYSAQALAVVVMVCFYLGAQAVCRLSQK